MPNVTAPAAYSHLTRTELIDHVLTLLHFDATGDDCDTAMGLMRWNNLTSEELQVRHRDPNRPILRPLPHQTATARL